MALSSPLPPAVVVVATFDNVALTKYFSAIGFAIVLYDTLLTLSDEIRLIWPERWNLAKSLFYVNRVLSLLFIALNAYHLSGLAPKFSTFFCQVLVVTTGYGAIFAFGIANWLLMSRAIALWGGTQKVVWCMTIFYLTSYIATITIATVASVETVGNISYSSQVHTCALTSRPDTFGAIWVPSILFELVLFGMLFTKLVAHARQSAGTASELIRVLHRDGNVYFGIVFCLRIVNLVAWTALPLSLVFIGIFILWSFTTVLLTRLLLNLKSLGATPLSEDLDRTCHVDPSIDFRHPSPGSLGRDNVVPRIKPVVLVAKRGRRKTRWARRDFDLETNVFPGGTAVDPDRMGVYLVADDIAVTRPGTGVTDVEYAKM